MFPISILAFAAAASPADIRLTPRKPAPARTLVLSAQDMLRLAAQRESAGDLEFVTMLYKTLESDADSTIRAEARFRRAKLLLNAKRNEEAAILLRRLLDEQPTATMARLELAHALQLLGDNDGALRQFRAAQAAGLPPAVARIVQRYSDALRSQRPSGASFEVAIAPDSNISRATSSDTLGTVFGDFDIDKDSKARSGTGLALSGQVYRRVGFGSSGHDLLVRASGFANLYRHSRFDDTALDLAAGPELRLGPSRLNLELGATQRWYGLKPFTRSIRAGATWVQPIGALTQLRLDGSLSKIKNWLNLLQGGRSYSARLSIEHALSQTLGVGINLSTNRLAARDDGYSTTGWDVNGLAWRDLGRATITAEIGFGRLRADERLVLFPHKRSDRSLRFAVGATFRQLTFGGFAPVARLTIERNRSSIEFYDYKRVRTEFGITRAF